MKSLATCLMPLLSCLHWAILRWPCPGKMFPRLCSQCVLTCAGVWRSLDTQRVAPDPGPECPNIARVPGTQGHSPATARPPGISSAISRLSLRPPRSRAVNEDLFMFGMDSSRNGPKNSDGNFIVVWDNINNPDILLWPEMWHVSYWKKDIVKTNPKANKIFN